MRRGVMVVVTVLGLVVTGTGVVPRVPAGAEEGARVDGGDDAAEVEVWSDPGASSPSTPERSGRSGRTRSGPTRTCSTVGYPVVDGVYAEYGRADVGTGWLYYRICGDGDSMTVSRWFRPLTGATAPSAPAVVVADRARATLTAPALEPRLNPGPPAAPLAGMETWLWVDEADWTPVSATAAVAGISATVTATPIGLSWDLAEGEPPSTCAGRGTRYDPARPASEQSTECSAVFADHGTHATTVTVRWQVRWTATDGSSGELADMTSSTPLTVTVRERYAVG